MLADGLLASLQGNGRLGELQARLVGPVSKAAFIVVLLLAFAAIGETHRYLLDNGETIDFEETEGKWVVLSYWAIWCGPCREEVKILNKLHMEQEEHNALILGVNFDGLQGDQLAEDKEILGVMYPDLLQDPKSRWGVRRAKVIPETIIINPAGKLHAIITGETTRNQILKKLST